MIPNFLLIQEYICISIHKCSEKDSYVLYSYIKSSNIHLWQRVFSIFPTFQSFSSSFQIFSGLLVVVLILLLDVVSILF